MKQFMVAALAALLFSALGAASAQAEIRLLSGSGEPPAASASSVWYQVAAKALPWVQIKAGTISHRGWFPGFEWGKTDPLAPLPENLKGVGEILSDTSIALVFGTHDGGEALGSIRQKAETERSKAFNKSLDSTRAEVGAGLIRLGNGAASVIAITDGEPVTFTRTRGENVYAKRAVVVIVITYHSKAERDCAHDEILRRLEDLERRMKVVEAYMRSHAGSCDTTIIINKPAEIIINKPADSLNFSLLAGWSWLNAGNQDNRWYDSPVFGVALEGQHGAAWAVADIRPLGLNSVRDHNWEVGVSKQLTGPLFVWGGIAGATRKSGWIFGDQRPEVSVAGPVAGLGLRFNGNKCGFDAHAGMGEGYTKNRIPCYDERGPMYVVTALFHVFL